MMSFVSREKKAGRQPFMDPLNPIKAKVKKRTLKHFFCCC